MAEIKVSQLPEASAINDEDLIMIVQNGTNKKITKENCQFASGDEVAISTTEPSEEEKLWINPSETTNQAKFLYNNAWQELTIKALDSMPIGSELGFYGSRTKVPTGWLLCEGQAISRTEYSDLFELIGVTYGAGDGSTTFNIPNKKGRVGVGVDQSQTEFDTLGETGGSKALQRHNHLVGNSAGAGSTSAWGIPSEYNSNMGELHTSEAGTGDSGNLQPYIVEYYIIKAKNTTPTMASVVDAYSTSTQDAYSCNYVNGKTGVVLYDNASGSTGAITLSDSIANYTEIEIEYARDVYVKTTGRVKNKNNIRLDGYWYYYDSSLGKVVYQNFCEMIFPSGTSIPRGDTYYTNVIDNTNYTGNFSGGVSIYRVIGYK